LSTYKWGDRTVGGANGGTCAPPTSFDISGPIGGLQVGYNWQFKQNWLAGIEADSISYIEAHGTGTLLGDPIEIAALTQAFRATTPARGFCAIGSVKTNVGHLEAAAGVTGLIKTVLALKNQQLPPSLHFRQPNPQMDFHHSPFYVNTRLDEWQPSSVRWAWSLNAASSVMGSAGAMVCAIYLGLIQTLLIGGALYLVALVVLRTSAAGGFVAER